MLRQTLFEQRLEAGDWGKEARSRTLTNR
jgi:hypothetical protein